jgi:hypothetical protein
MFLVFLKCKLCHFSSIRRMDGSDYWGIYILPYWNNILSYKTCGDLFKICHCLVKRNKMSDRARKAKEATSSFAFHVRDCARKAKEDVGRWRHRGRDNGRKKRECRRPFRGRLHGAFWSASFMCNKPFDADARFLSRTNVAYASASNGLLYMKDASRRVIDP